MAGFNRSENNPVPPASLGGRVDEHRRDIRDSMLFSVENIDSLLSERRSDSSHGANCDKDTPL